MKLTIKNDLFKAMHKYIKRTGSKGSYKYWYKLPDGRIVSDDDASSPHSNDEAKIEHVKRLIAGRMRGIHTKTNEQIGEEAGVEKTKVGQHERNMRRPTSTTHNDYHESHLHEANTDVNHEAYQGHVRAIEAQHDGGSTPTRSRGNRASESRETSAAPSESARQATPNTSEAQREPRRARRERSTSNAQASSGESRQEANQEQRAGGQESPQDRNASTIQEKRQKLKELFGIDLGVKPARTAQPQSTATSEPESNEDAQIRENVARANQQLEQARQSEARAREAVARAESSPTQPHAQEMAASDPTFARDEAEISSMIEEQRRGGNPYLSKAKNVFERISSNVKPERRITVSNILAAISYLQDEDRPLNKENILEEYRRISNHNVRSINGIADEFEKATFFTLDEVMGNEPINAEIERMKRGYAAKQFARSKPFLKPEWLQANAGAPPPYPTFGDFKSWSQHGGKPEWAGTTRLAVPKEIFDAAPKGADGKPKYPPAWMPLHLMPVWNYAYKRMGTDDAYQATGTGITSNSNEPTGFSINMGDQAAYQEGMIKASIRKYVQMRGGRNQLTDIPKSKLAEAGLTHADIYKAEDEDDIEQILKTKIIDPVALAPYIDAEIAKTRVKKSFSLVIKKGLEPFIDEKKAEEIKKSELIAKIKAAKQARQFVIGRQI